MKHGRGTRGAAPASDAATRWGRRVPPRRAMWIPHAFSRLALTWLRLGPICVESGRLRQIQAEIQKKKKEKKKVQNAPFDLYLNPTLAQFTQMPKHKLSTSPHISSLTCLCALCLSASFI